VGPAGAPGPQGPQGPKGDPGTLASFDSLAGLSCTIGGASGTIALEWDGQKRAIVTCVVGTPPPPPPPPATGLRVNEIQTGGTVSAADEFVEIVNGGTSSVNIGGWKLVYRSAAGTSDIALATIPDGTTIVAGGFYLLGGSSYAGPPAADQSFSTSLAAGGGGVALRDGSGTIVDAVGYGTATNSFVEGTAVAAPPGGSSAARIPDGKDTNNNASDLTVTATPTPRAANK
jgi:hypothetical protein